MRQKEFTNPTSAPLSSRREGLDTSEQLDEICRWIDEHSQEQITWEDLTRASGLDHRLLVKLFQIHKKTTPMTYLRLCRQGMTA